MEQEKQAEVIKVEAVPLMEAQARAEIDMQIATAKRYPRSLKVFRDQVLEMATLDKETAESCWYALPRGGKVIEGPSIRFAEIVLSCYGNLRAATRPSSEDNDNVTAQAVCMDLEKNVGVQVENKRRIKDKLGRRYNEDMITNTANAAASIALRNAVFRVVPKAIYKRVFDEVKAVGMGDGRTLSATREAIVEHFRKLRVELPRICALLERTTEKPHKGIEDITLEDATLLRGIANAIKDGEITAEEAFEIPEVTRATIPATALKAGKTAEHTHPSVPPTKKKAEGKSDAQRIVDGRNKLREMIKKIQDEELMVDLDGIMFSAGVDSIDRCENPEALEKAVKGIEDALKGNT